MGNASPLRVLLEGRPGIGKTTVTRRLIALLRDVGVPLGGFVTHEIRVRGRREVAVVATVQLHQHPLTDALKRRPDVQVLRVTEHSRDALPDQLAAELRTVGAAGRAR